MSSSESLKNIKKARKEFISYTMFALSSAELKRVLDSCSDMSDYIMILLASRYGFRREDIVNIKVSDINLQQSTLTYYEEKKDRTRTIPIESDVVIELKRYIGTIPGNQKTLLKITDGSSAWNHFQKLCAIAGVSVPPGRTGRPFHSLRGTCVKMRQKQGWTNNEVAALIGDDPGTVAKHYATTSPGELADKMRGI